MKTISRKEVYRLLRTWGSILFGNALLAFLIAAFVLPHDIMMGGTTGIGIVIARVTGIDTALMVLIFNVVLLGLGGLILGRRFFVTTAASSVLYPAFLAIFERMPGVAALTQDPLLASIFAGVLLGVSLGMVMRVGSSTGGMDIVSLILNKWFRHIPVSVFVYILDFIILGAQALFIEPEQVLYGLLLLVLESIVLDKVMILGTAQIQIFAVSARSEVIRARILTELQAGTTMVNIQTGLMGQSGKGVMCVIPPSKLYAATQLIQSIDPEVFMTITQIKEVHGQGFTTERRQFPPVTTADYTASNMTEPK